MCASMKMSTNTSRAGTLDANITHTGKPSGIGDTNQPRSDASVGDTPAGTFNFCEKSDNGDKMYVYAGDAWPIIRMGIRHFHK